MSKLIVFVGVLLFLGAFGAAFQLFGRYNYVVDGQTVWRVDRLTNHSCLMVQQQCVIPTHNPSTSTSLSTSTSTLYRGSGGHAKKT